MQKILMCYHSSEYGGVEQQILDIIEGLSKEFEITVVCPSGSLVKDYLKAGAIRHVDLTPKNEADLLYSYKIAKLVRKHKIDIVHGHELKSGSLSIFGGFLASASKRVYHVHTPFGEWRHSSFKKYLALLPNTIVNAITGNIFATDVLALTESIKQIRIKREYIRSSQIRVISNGIHLDELVFSEEGRKVQRNRYSISDDTIVFGYVARFTEEKGHEYLIKAYSELISEKADNTRLYLAGGGKLLESMKDLVNKLDISDYVIFTDRFKDDEKNDIYSSFDVFVFPTYAEGFGIVLIEAMAMQLPVIASDIPVLHDVGENAVIYAEVENSMSWKDKMKRLEQNSNLRLDMKVKSINQSQKYSMNEFYEKYKLLYKGELKQ